LRLLMANSMKAMGGGERWLLEAADGLASRGHDVSVAARTGSAVATVARSAGHPVLEVPMRGDADVQSVFALARWMRETQTDVLSVNVQRAVRLGCVAARLAHVGVVVERRGLELTVRNTAINRTVYQKCLSHVVANCRAIGDALVAAGTIESDRVSVIPNGIDPERVPKGGGDAVRAEFSIPAEAPLVAVIGRLVPDKGIEVAVGAFAELLGEIPAARLIVAGSGGLLEELKREARRSAPESRIIFAGYREDVPAVLDAAQVLLVTSSREGMPHVILEAMAAGTPVVATRVAGIPEMIEDGRDGLLIAPGSEASAKVAVRRILSDPHFASSLARAAAERVRRDFSLNDMIDSFEELFLALLGATDR
jgi:glycosyltransferase involved in cell wall biosynthesis